jgi:DNA repair protein RadA/Sms
LAKVKTAFFCSSCGYESSKWLGKCSSCGEWNTFVEEVIEKNSEVKLFSSNKTTASKPKKITEIVEQKLSRWDLQDEELNRVLGGGLVPGSLTLVGGEPGIGKSTLMLQIALKPIGKKILYVSGEESEQQIRMRADRLGIVDDNSYILSETSLQNIFKQIEELKPEFLIIDSIQTLQTAHIESSPGSVSQIRECTGELLRFAKETNTAVFLIGHITKDGNLAGPKVLEHMVDTVLQFEGDRHHFYRLLRSVKNRFGSTNELGIYEMHGGGLREVSNPFEVLITERDEDASGVAISASIEGIRPMLIEVQALVGASTYGNPQRSGTGFDLRRMSMLLAVLEKRCGFRLSNLDVFLNIAGGLKVEEPGIDLAVIAAIMSSASDIAIPSKYCFSAEVGLSGEIRPVSRVEHRINEAEKMGFEKIFISKNNLKGLDILSFKNIDVVPLTKVEDLYRRMFSN